jgi:hypothetical protein
MRPTAGRMARMGNMAVLAPPSLADMRIVLPEYGTYRFDQTLAAARKRIGPDPDPANIDHARRLRVWLNQWICRIGYPRDERDLFAESLAGWWSRAGNDLPPAGRRLAELDGGELRTISDSYGDLCKRPAAISRTGKTRTFGPTATAKVLYFVRPDAITAWDKAISACTGKGSDQEAFLRHLTLCRAWAVRLEQEGSQLGLRPDEIGRDLGRPASSVAKVIDEWLYATITGGFGGRSR